MKRGRDDRHLAVKWFLSHSFLFPLIFLLSLISLLLVLPPFFFPPCLTLAAIFALLFVCLSFCYTSFSPINLMSNNSKVTSSKDHLFIESARTTSKERAISCKTLVSFIQSLVNQIVEIELKNDTIVKGYLVQVDAYMNCTLQSTDIVQQEQPHCSSSKSDSGISEVRCQKVEVSTPINFMSSEYKVTNYDHFFIKGTRIRYVEVPQDIDPIESIKQQISEHRRIIRSRAAGQGQPKTKKTKY